MLFAVLLIERARRSRGGVSVRARRESTRKTWTKKSEPKTGIVLTEAKRSRRARSIALALALGALVLLFYIVTLVKGPAVLNRPL